MTVFEFVVLALCSYRLQRFVTEDSLPPTKRLREWTAERFGPESAWHTLATCGWCLSVWTCATVFSEHALLGLVPMWVYAAFAAATLVGVIAELLALAE